MKKKFKQNPFLVSFAVFALICCLILTIEFFSIIHSNNKETQEHYYQEKIEILLEDFELQLETFESMAFRFSLNNTYKYSVISQKKYNENLLLEDFKTHRYSSALTEELFLYYGGNNIFHVTGNTIDLDVYLKDLSYSEKDVVTAALTVSLENSKKEALVISSAREIYILTPFQTGTGTRTHMAVLSGVVSFEAFGERLQVISGGLDGTISLYSDNTLVYCNQETPCSSETQNILTAATQDGKYTLYYLPKKIDFSFQQILLETFLILADALLILIIARIFAKRTFQPIKDIHNKYQPDNVPPENHAFPDVFSEIDSMINNALSHYMSATKQVEQMQAQLKQQILKQLLNKTYSLDVQSHLNTLGISLPGPFYYVTCVSFIKKNGGEDILPHVQKDLEQISFSNVLEAIYVVCDSKTKQLWVICNLPDCSRKMEMTDSIIEVAESYFQDISVGVGKIYNSLDKISASWLESIDNMNHSHSNENKSFIHDSSDLWILEEALSTGSTENAQNWLDEYIKKQEKTNLSILMLQYSIAEFIGEISKLSKRNAISLSNQNISLLISARDLNSFHEGARELILEYCDKYRQRTRSLKYDQEHQICQYIDEHFMEYDISIELIAENLGTSTAAVRDAVLKSTGMMYKDYLVNMRMEYAKSLLQEGELSVAEVSQAVGYSSVSYFIRLFKHTTGFTPAKYIKRISSSTHDTEGTHEQ